MLIGEWHGRVLNASTGDRLALDALRTVALAVAGVQRHSSIIRRLFWWDIAEMQDNSYEERMRRLKSKVYSSGVPYAAVTDKSAENMLIRLESQNPYRRVTSAGAVVEETCCDGGSGPVVRYQATVYNANPQATPEDDMCTPAFTLEGIGASDAYVVRYDEAGQALWGARLGGTLADNGLSVTAIDDACCIAGIFTSPTLEIYDQGGVAPVRTLPGGGRCIFIVMYDANGNVEWAARSTDIGPDIFIVSVASDSGGNIYITGSFATPIIQFYTANDASSSLMSQTSGATATGFLVKYNSTGTTIEFANTFATPTGGRVLCNAITCSGAKIYVTGAVPCTGATTFNGPTSGIVLTPVSGALSNAFLVKYDCATGEPEWATKIGGSTADKPDAGVAVTTDSTGDVYVTGYYKTQNTEVYNASGSSYGPIANIVNGSSIFVVKYDITGSVTWVSRVTAPDNGSSPNPKGNAIVTDSANAYVNCLLSLGPATCFSTSTIDTFNIVNTLASVVIAFDYSSGNFNFFQYIYGEEETDNIIGYGISGLANGFYTGGVYSASPLHIGRYLANDYTLKNDGDNDGYLIKYDENGTVKWRTRVGGTGYQDIAWVAATASGGCYVVGNYGSGLA